MCCELFFDVQLVHFLDEWGTPFGVHTNTHAHAYTHIIYGAWQISQALRYLTHIVSVALINTHSMTFYTYIITYLNRFSRSCAVSSSLTSHSSTSSMSEARLLGCFAPDMSFISCALKNRISSFTCVCVCMYVCMYVCMSFISCTLK